MKKYLTNGFVDYEIQKRKSIDWGYLERELAQV